VKLLTTSVDKRLSCGQRYGFLRPYSRFSRQEPLLFLPLYSRGWADPVPDPLLVRKYGRAGNRTQTSGSVARNSDHIRGWHASVIFSTAWRLLRTFRTSPRPTISPVDVRCRFQEHTAKQTNLHIAPKLETYKATPAFFKYIHAVVLDETASVVQRSESLATFKRSGFDPRRYQIPREVVGLEWGPHSLVSTTEELCGRKTSGSGLEGRDYGSGNASPSILKCWH
jgi:hypothetical protein